MPHSRESIYDIDEDFVRDYINTGTSRCINENQQRMIDITRETYRLLCKVPIKNIVVNQLCALHEGMKETSADRYVNFVQRIYNVDAAVDRKFLETWTVNRLIQEISDKDADPSDRSKNLATMFKYLATIPRDNVDPKLMEKNTVNIQINAGNKNITIPEKVLQALPMAVREQLLSSVPMTINPEEAAEIIKDE